MDFKQIVLIRQILSAQITDVLRAGDEGHTAALDGHITAEKAMNARQPGADVWVYMCGPPPMMTALADGFRRLGIPATRVRWEQFNIR